MASRRTKAFRTHRELHYRRHNARNVRTFALVVILISATALFGCGGGVSTAGQQGNSTPGTGTGAAILTWAAPTTYVNGAPLTGLSGYKVYYGTAPGVYTSIDVGNVTSYQIDGLTKGQTYYFTVTDYDIHGVESDYATVVNKVIS